MSRFSSVGLALVLLAALLVGCGDDDGDGDDGAAPTTTVDETADGEGTTDADTDADTDTDGEVDTDGDAANGDGGSGDDGACEATVPDTQLDYAVFAPSRSLDPPMSSGSLVGGTELAAIYDVLMRFNPDTAEFEPQLAQSMTGNADSTVWTLELREGIAFDDGSPLDADLVLANLERYAPTDDTTVVNTAPAFLGFIESSRKVDDLTVEFTLTQSWAGFPFVFNDEPGMIVNVNAIGDDAEAFGALPPPEAGVGPYVVERNVSGEELVLVARDNYWGGAVCIERIRFDLATASAIVGSQAAYEALQNGDLDVAFIRDAAVFEDAREAGVMESVAFQDAGVLLFFNVRDGEALSDPALREAIALSIDVDLLNERAFGGNLTVAKSLFAEGSPYYSDSLDTIDTDPEAAAELVTTSGFDETLRVLCPTTPSDVEVSLAVEAMIEGIGLDVTVENLPTTEFAVRRGEGSFDIACGGYNIGPDTASFSLLRNLSSESSVNRSGVADPELDEAINATFAATAAELPAAMSAVNTLFVENHYGVPVGNLLEGILHADDVVGIKQTGSTIFLFDSASLLTG